MLTALAAVSLAAPHDPRDFASLGSLAGDVSVDSKSDPPTLTTSTVTVEGEVVDGDAVFTFDDVDLGDLDVVDPLGARPIVVLSRGDLRVSGWIAVDATGYDAPGPGGHLGRQGSGGDGLGPEAGHVGGGGAGGAGPGGDRSDMAGSGGSARTDDPLARLQGGSGGGRSNEGGSGDGGSGGGAVELGALGSLVVEAAAGIDASGGDGEADTVDGGGGGAGGTLVLHAASGRCDPGGFLSVGGGQGGDGDDDSGGGGSGGFLVALGVDLVDCDLGDYGGSGGDGSGADGDDGSPASVVTTADLDGDGLDWDADCDDFVADEGVGDGRDSDCDGGELCWLDSDDDGFRSVTPVVSADLACDSPREAAATAPVDCDDTNASVTGPGAEIADDGIDNDCDGREECYADRDDDGYRTDRRVASDDLDCTDPGEAGGATPDGDCLDNDPNRNPGALEVAADGVDQDCDGGDACWADQDGDGDRSDVTTVRSVDLDCVDPYEAVGALAIDCDDLDYYRNSLATELPGDGVDQDCAPAELCYTDADGDGFRTAEIRASPDESCGDPGEALRDQRLDCDDTEELAFPGAPEAVCDGVDNDCEPSTLDVPDADGDGIDACSGDCDDASAGVHPGAEERCDGVDTDCDGRFDNGFPSETFHPDLDRDGFGDARTAVEACVPPPDHVPDGTDCDDAAAEVHPDAAEQPCNGVDDDCDPGSIDEADVDGDGTSSCADCDDADPELGAPAEGDVCPDPRPGCPECRALGDRGCGCTTPGGSPGEAIVLAGLALLRRRRP